MKKWFLKSGEMVIDRFDSHIHQSVKVLLPEALAQIKSWGRYFFLGEVNFDRIIGENICVSTGIGDQIIYARRPKRWGHTRFVLNRQPEPCSTIVVILKKEEDGDYYIIITAFIGIEPEPEPWDRKNLRTEVTKQKAREFWTSHALVWGVEPTIPGTETEECPW